MSTETVNKKLPLGSMTFIDAGDKPKGEAEKNQTPDRLFCVAVEEWVRGKVVETHLVYVHADNIPHAARVYRQSQPNSARYHIVTAGKAIAYKVQDTQGLVLCA